VQTAVAAAAAERDAAEVHQGIVMYKHGSIYIYIHISYTNEYTFENTYAKNLAEVQTAVAAAAAERDAVEVHQDKVLFMCGTIYTCILSTQLNIGNHIYVYNYMYSTRLGFRPPSPQQQQNATGPKCTKAYLYI